METITPMLQQYQQIKKQHKDCILFFRLGDFYEMFFEDAQTGSKVLDLVLTSRGKGTSNHIPMCGVPYHAADAYIAKLVKSGHKVAICEQMENPAEAQGIVKRDVIRVVSSGTFLDEHSSDSRYILCLSPNGKAIGLSFIDPVSGTIQSNQYADSRRIVEILARLPVYECVFPMSAETTIKNILQHPLLKIKNITLSPHEDWCFNTDIAKKNLCEHFKIHNLAGFGVDSLSSAISSAGALLEYLKQMNKQPLRHIDKVSLYADDDYVFISPAATYGLELENLFKTINQTQTALGKRKFHYWLYHPLKDPEQIAERQKAVTLLKNSNDILRRLKDLFSRMPDIEKCVSKMSCGYTHARDLLAIRNALDLLPDLQQTISSLARDNNLFTVEDIPALRTMLAEAINPEMPLTNNEGKVIKKGFHLELDQLKDIQENGRDWLRHFQESEIKRTGINSLKVGFNRVFGYYIEISKGSVKNAPANYIRKQTLVNGERYITPELKEYEDKILTAQEKIFKIETAILEQLQKAVLDHAAQLHLYSQAIATIDSLYSLAILAQLPKYILPEVTELTPIDIKEGRHPVVEQLTLENFVPNDTYLDCEENHLIILTGPNMAGKSTYIRQIAVLVILAQMGSYIPASSASIGIVDKIFTRIGAHDDISKGQSTFMVEMNETADILNNLTDRSLVILDEIGRGTSTYDGLSLAWALAEHFQKTKARVLFATHFHELTALADEPALAGGKHSGIKNYNVAVKEWKDEIIFLHKIIPGSTDDSYGIYVAKLAGIPQNIINRSKKILTQLELKTNLKEKLTAPKGTDEQLSLFMPAEDPAMKKIKDMLESMDVNNLTPMEALNKIQELKEIIEEDKL